MKAFPHDLTVSWLLQGLNLEDNFDNCKGIGYVCACGIVIWQWRVHRRCAASTRNRVEFEGKKFIQEINISQRNIKTGKWRLLPLEKQEHAALRNRGVLSIVPDGDRDYSAQE
ncbi:MAG: hypothetical protein Q8M57_08765 [Nitrosomonas sp.]|uniref:hypothetical protein n=1 Tax=Nitrosomonas sp. TaxID=42353 RepID=UPI002736DD87|nr:hypothetical protein [Nitrosomonas sp.]MDP3281118.1 hypothetical protein [Nitrosomonas sp.]